MNELIHYAGGQWTFTYSSFPQRGHVIAARGCSHAKERSFSAEATQAMLGRAAHTRVGSVAIS